MAEELELSESLQQFIESMGVFFERYGVSRIGGRMLGLLIVAERELTLDEIAATLHVSRASVSTNARILTLYGMAQLVTRPGDRRDYYRLLSDTWSRAMEAELEATLEMRRIGERGLAAARVSDRAATEHLEELIAYCDLVLEDRRITLEHWRNRKHSKDVKT
jgi:DNA-binding transcriptional regulator GbsR (MarR family)